ncbi:tRNA glutamyl-Q(34) synthetase GluQRS [Paenibacillus chitinolyticus]
MSSNIVRGRFAPTPSGELHIGNARTALLAWLQTRAAGGTFVLRMEDIDKPRCRPELAEQITEDLRWLGLHWDEGPEAGDPFGPYVQSARGHLYEEALQTLRERGHLYPCYCSRAELHAISSAPHGLSSEGPSYPGTCRFLTEAEREARAAVKAPAFRFAMPAEDIAFRDLAAGAQVFPGGAGGDFVVQRADGIVAYQLAAAVDDAAMGITDVLRGWDLLDSTPRQLMLLRALGCEPPRYTHVPLLYGPDGQRLSKRHGSLSVSAIRRAGVPAETLLGVLAYLSGLTNRPEPVQADELTRDFRLAAFPRHPVQLSRQLLRLLSAG